MNKMRRIISVLLAVVMLAGLLGTAMFTSAAAKPYKDVTTEDWFYENVKSLKKMKLMIGYHDGTFRPENNISLAESITVAARLHAAENKAGALKQGDVWYEVYTDYAVKNQLVDKLSSDVLAPATRLEFAHLLAKALPLDNFVMLNRVPEGAIPDVASDEAIYMLYRAGVLIGADDSGNFYPDRPITRAETAAIITRMADPSLRLKSGIFGIADVEVDGQGNVKNETAINADGANATVAAGTAAEEGATKLELSVIPMEATGSNLQVEDPQVLNSYDVHIDGLAADNSVPVIVELDTLVQSGLNLGNLAVYHVENGETVAMTQVASLSELDAHNEFYYDPATGKLTVAMATFSEVAVVADVKAAWAGEIDTSWYNETGTAFSIANADQLAGLGKLVDEGNTFAGKTITLLNDINLGGQTSFDPIGWGYDYDGYTPNGKTFNGTFDGNHKLISNLYQNGWDLGTEYSYSMAGGGLFASAVDATFKNVSITGADIVMECIDMGILVGYAQGNCTFDHIQISNSKIANYQRATGGVIGEVSPKRNSDGSVVESTHTLKDVIVGSDVVVGSLWGDFDAPCGGVIGARWDDSNSTYVRMTNVNVAARMDVYNDITSAYRWHAYRRAGMLIGNTDTPPADGRTAKTATAEFLTCTNVQVGYGSWANYHYCQFTNENNPGRNYPWVRTEAGENCEAYSNPRYGHPKDKDDNPVVNDGHAHKDEDEGHLVLLPFAQLYGGGQGVYGAVSHAGVLCKNAVYTVTYMNGSEIEELFYVTDNSTAYSLKNPGENMQWLDNLGNKLTSIPAGNTKNVNVYKDAVKEKIAYFLDKDGIVIYQENFKDKQTQLSANAPASPPEVEGYIGKWESYDLAKATGSIFIRPIYTIDDNFKPVELLDADQLFRLLEESQKVYMTGDLTAAGQNLNGSKHNLCEMNGDTSRLNFNSFTLTCNFSHNANKQWHVFNLINSSTLTIASGVNSEGTLKMNIGDAKNNVYVFYLDATSTLILEKGVVIEVKYPTNAKDKVFAFNIGEKIFTPNTTDYPGLYVQNDTEQGILRIVVSETTTISGDAQK